MKSIEQRSTHVSQAHICTTRTSKRAVSIPRQSTNTVNFRGSVPSVPRSFANNSSLLARARARSLGRQWVRRDPIEGVRVMIRGVLKRFNRGGRLRPWIQVGYLRTQRRQLFRWVCRFEGELWCGLGGGLVRWQGLTLGRGSRPGKIMFIMLMDRGDECGYPAKRPRHLH